MLIILPAIFFMALSAYCLMKLMSFVLNKRSRNDLGDEKSTGRYGDDFDEAFT